MYEPKSVVTEGRAYEMGRYAAHEEGTQVCPFSRLYEHRLYDAWYNGLADERKFLKRKGLA